MKGVIVRVLFCMGTLLCGAFFAIHKENQITQLRLKIPQLKKEVTLLSEQNTQLAFEKEMFERPENLLKCVSSQEYASLSHPSMQHVVVLPKGFTLAKYTEKKHTPSSQTIRAKLAYKP